MDNPPLYFTNLDSLAMYLEYIESTERDLSQVRRCHVNHSHEIPLLIERVIEKYNSDAYRKKWFDLGHHESPDGLYWFIYRYAIEYGREATHSEIELYGNSFTSEMYILDEYYINRMDGLGSVIQVRKIK
jgi:hypothetical protein